MRRPGETLPQTRVRPQRQGSGGLKQKNSQNLRGQKNRKTFFLGENLKGPRNVSRERRGMPEVNSGEDTKEEEGGEDPER